MMDFESTASTNSATFTLLPRTLDRQPRRACRCDVIGIDRIKAQRLGIAAVVGEEQAGRGTALLVDHLVADSGEPVRQDT
jgi:hypothetical protein